MSTDPIVKAMRAYQRAQDAVNSRRADLTEAIVQAILVDGRRQAEVAKLTGYTREHIRRICREHVDTLNSIDEFEASRSDS